MDEAERKYREELKANGVELSDESADEPEAKPEDEADDEAKVEPAKVKTEEPKAEHLQTPKEQRKRSIYDEYKDKKNEARTQTERAEIAERERDELKTRLEALDNADTPEEKKEAKDDLEAFAEEIKADPAALKKMRDLFLKDARPAIDPELTKRLDRFEKWQKDNSASIEKTMFEDEFKSSLPKLDKLFPKMNESDRDAVKTELDKLSHTKDWHDKPLAYIAFENQETLSALVSPKKRGMESRDRKDANDELESDFDIAADYSKMTPAQKAVWEKQYKELTKSEGLITDSKGKKILL